MSKPGICKSMGSVGMHSHDLAGIIEGTLSIIFGRSQQLGEIRKDWRKENVMMSSLSSER